MSIARLSAASLASLLPARLHGGPTRARSRAPHTAGARPGWRNTRRRGTRRRIPRRGGVGFGPQNRQKQLDAIRDQLEAGDDEWKALSPKVEKLLVAKQNTSTGAGMRWTSANNAKPVVEASGDTPDTPAGKAMQEVRDAAADKDATNEELAKKMAAVREARRKRAPTTRRRSGN